MALVMLLSVCASFSFSAQAKKVDLSSSGKCGEKATYTFNSETGLLTISGTGKIWDDAFYKRSEIKKVVIKKGITKIGFSSFHWSGVEELVLPDGITDIELYAFGGTPYTLNTDNLDGNAVYNNGYLLAVNNDWYDMGDVPEEERDFKIKKGTVLIAAGAFRSVVLDSVEVPSGVKYIGQMAFYAAEIPTITLPASLTSIYDDSFAENYSIKDVYFKGSRSDAKKIKSKDAYSGNVEVLGSKMFAPLFWGEEYNPKPTVHYAKVSAPEVKSLTKGIKSFTIKWKKRTGAKGYQIQYATNKAMTKSKKSVYVKNNKTFTKKVSKLKSKKTYYVRMRSYKMKNGKKVYSSWSTVKKIKTK